VTPVRAASDSHQQGVGIREICSQRLESSSRRNDGTRVDYGIADDGVFELCEQVCGSL
jgi:hypothetical protein